MVPTSSLPRSPGHPFYVALNKLLAEAKFDEFVEKLCAPLYSEGGRPSIPPGVYFRMLLVGYFENIDSQRGIAWRCCDSMSLRTFLGLQVTQASPDHSSLTVIRRRISKELIDEVFAFVLKIAVAKHVLKAGGAVGVVSSRPALFRRCPEPLVRRRATIRARSCRIGTGGPWACGVRVGGGG